TPETSTLSLHDALPISDRSAGRALPARTVSRRIPQERRTAHRAEAQREEGNGAGTTESGCRDRHHGCLAPKSRHRAAGIHDVDRSEEHTSELQSLAYLV